MDTAETGDSCAHTARCAVLVTPQDKAPALPLALDLVILLPHEAWLYCDHCSFRSALPGYSQYLSQGMPLSPHPLSSLSIRFLRDGPPPPSASGPVWASSPPAPPSSCSTALLAEGHLRHVVQPHAALRLPPRWNPLGCPILWRIHKDLKL